MTVPRAITATIITLDEEDNITEAVTSAKRVCDEVFVIDSGSSDRTRELAQEAGAKVIRQHFLGDGAQKDFAVDLAKNDWILSLDADERLSDEAVAEILSLDLDGSGADGYMLRRKNHIGGRWIKIWYPDRLVRLYDRRKCRYRHDHIHAAVNSVNPVKLASHILHYSYADYADYARGVVRYGVWGAEVMESKGRPSSPLAAVIHGFGAFVRQYLSRGGIFHGFDGLVVSVSTAYCVFLKYAILREKGNAKKR